MFNVISSYLFGAEKPNLEDIEEKEYRTLEADDWLLVDVQDENIRPQSSEWNLPVCDEFLSAGDISDRDFLPACSKSPTPLVPLQAQVCLLPPTECVISKRFSRSFLEELPSMEEMKQKLHRAGTLTMLTSLYPKLMTIEYIMFSKALAKKFPKPEKKLTAAELKKAGRAKASKPYPSKARNDKYTYAQITCGFVNPQAPALQTKSELLQQIKEIKPMQQVKEYELKKRINRSQLNRQNKVYHYDTSNKNQHRRDLWMRHSGANNNRKCC